MPRLGSSVVEQGPEEPRVVSSILTLGTTWLDEQSEENFLKIYSLDRRKTAKSALHCIIEVKDA